MVISKHIAISLLLAKMYLKSQMEYRGAFMLDRVAQIASYGAKFAAIYVLLLKFSLLGGWDWSSMAMLLSFQLLSYAIGASLSYTQFRDMEEMVRLGTLDAVLVKPFSPWAYIVFSGINVGYLGHIVLALGLLVWSIFHVDVAWSPWTAIYLLLSLMSASMLVAALMTIIGASSIIFVKSQHLYAVFFGFWELGRYPLNIFPAAIQFAMLVAVPLAFMGYVPVAVLLGKDVPMLGILAIPISLLIGPATVLGAVAFWRYALSRHQGGGG